MNTWFIVLTISHVFVSISIIVLVLMQTGKGADAGAAFGSGASGTVFGAQGASNFLSRSTAILATLFFLLSLGLAYLSTQRTGPASLVDTLPETEISAAPSAVSPEAVELGEFPEIGSDAVDTADAAMDEAQQIIEEAADAAEDELPKEGGN